MTGHRASSRELMEKAVEVMKESIAEIRDDKKICPKVGAVIQKVDGSIETAFRSELRNGDHAEYTLLERKNGIAKLDEAVLFTTLEPCAPGSRKNGKLSCAERIVNSRIREVWIGIQDPDPKVQGMGQKYLLSKGVKVHLFDSDLQEEIRIENKDFLNQAIIRAIEDQAKKGNEIYNESDFGLITNYKFVDLSTNALNYYREHAAIIEDIDSEKFQNVLLYIGVLAQNKGNLLVTKLGYLLFGESPRTLMPQAGLSVTLHTNNDIEVTQNFFGPTILIPHSLERWLNEKFPTRLNRNQMVHHEELVIPMKVIRESVINAIIHRDYSIQGSKCHLEITDNMIVIKSPGMPMEPITLDQLNSYKAPASNRNPKLAFIFSQTGLAEERGLGMRSFSMVDREFSLPRPSYKFEDPYLIFTQFRNRKSSINALSKNILDQLSESEKRGWELLSNETEISREEYQYSLEINARTAQRHFKKFSDLGLLTVVGSGPSTRYQVKKP